MATLRKGKQKVDKEMVYFILEIVLVVGLIAAFCIFREEIIEFVKRAQNLGLIRPLM